MLYNKLKYRHNEILLWSSLAVLYFMIGLNMSWEFGIFNAVHITLGQIIISKLNSKWLLPKYYFKHDTKSYNKASIITLTLFILTVTILEWVIFSVFDIKHPREHDVHVIMHYIMPLIFNFMVYGIAFFMTTAYTLFDHEQENRVHIEKLQKSQVETELRFLKTQINPHFLFNALNNIYTITYMGDQKAPEKILELSDMLRYVLYDCKADKVTLGKELEYIRNFIDFQQLKTEHSQNISLKIENVDESVCVAPMIIIPFIENSFKHSKIDRDDSGFINIDISQIKNKIYFNISNSIPDIPAAEWLQKNKGIGLENVKKRLNLIYPGKHSIEITNNNSVYTVKLEISVLCKKHSSSKDEKCGLEDNSAL